MKFRSICLVFILVFSFAIPATSSAEIDISQTVHWGPATEADSLLAHLRELRWLEDEEAFDELKADIWSRFPHHPGVIAETVLWYRDHQILAVLLDAIAQGGVDEITGLKELTPVEMDLLEAYVLVCAKRLMSGRKVVQEILAAQPLHPLGLFIDSLTRIGPDAWEETALKALADPDAAPLMFARILVSDPNESIFEYRDQTRSLLPDREPRPGLNILSASEEYLERIRDPGLTSARLAEIMDDFQAEHPAAFCGYLWSVVFAALVWVSPDAVLDLIEERSDLIPPIKLRRITAILLTKAGRPFDSYRILAEAGRTDGPVTERYILYSGNQWHPSPDELEEWARYSASNFLIDPGDPEERILRDRGYPEVADDLRRECELENPFTYQLHRVVETAIGDPTAGRALLDSLVSVVGERPLVWNLLLFAEKAGETDFLDKCLDKYGVFWTMRNFQAAILGAQDRADLNRLGKLHDLVRTHAPNDTNLRAILAGAFMNLGDLESAEEAIGEVERIDPSSSFLFPLRLDAAVRANDFEEARDLMTGLVESQEPPVDHLYLVPVFAERAGWSDLAARSQAMVEARAPEGCFGVDILRAEMNRVKGNLDETRTILLGMQVDWPGSELLNRALVEAGGIVETYEDSPGDLDRTNLAGLPFDYSSTDWILDGLAGPGEFPDQEFLVIRNRTTYCLWSNTQLVTRIRMTIEILSDPSAVQLETMRIPFDTEEEIPKILCARTITSEGKIREVPRNEILVTAHQEEEANVSDMRDLVVPFAGLKAGTVVDLCYQTAGSAFLGLGHSWTHTFGNLSPQREETVEFIIAKGVDHLLYTKHQPVEEETRLLDNATLHRFHLQDQPALHLEEMMEWEELFPHWVGCTTHESWDNVAGYFGKVFWENARSDSQVKDLAHRLADEGKDQEGRAQRLFNYVQNEITNIGIELGQGRFIPTTSNEVIARGYGDCKDKVATLTGLAREIGLECLPVLVGTRPSLVTEMEFPSSAGFDHLIAYFPGLNGGTFADPTLGEGCLEDLPQEVAGQTGLLIHPDGSGELIKIPELTSESARVEMEFDLYPETGGKLRVEGRALFHFGAGKFVAEILDNPDTTIVNSVVNLVLGNQVTEDFVVLEWSKREIGCGTIEIMAVLRDTIWTAPDENDATLVWVTAMDTAVELPSEEEREYAFALDSAKKFEIVIRAHEGAGLRLSPRHAPIKESGPGFHGEIAVKEHDTEEGAWLEIRRKVEFSQREYDPSEYVKLRDKYFSYRLAGFQPIQYYRESDQARLEEMRAYCRENPEDLAFSYQAALQVLGGDIGGDGDVGVERRVLARELLEPALVHPDVSGVPFILAASMAVKDNRFLEADSLLTEGLERSPRDPYLLSYAHFVSGELNNDEKQVEHLRKIQNVTGSEWPSYQLISHYLAVEDDDKAAKEENRLKIISAALDSVQLVKLKIAGYLLSNRSELAKELVPVAERLMSEEDFSYLLANIAALERRWDVAIEKLMPAHSEYPLSPHFNNDMAWYLACAGRDLERAEYLIRMAMALDSDSKRMDNTLALVLLRQGKRKEAEEIFARLMLDDRPKNRVVNGYFYGLCRWMEGHEEDAIQCWRRLEKIIPPDRYEYSMLVSESLAAVENGEDPTWIYLRPIEGD